MKAYKFTLESVQAVRRREEDSALQAYGRALQERTRASEQLAFAERTLASERNEWNRRTSSGCQASVLANNANGFQLLQRRIEDRKRLLAEAALLVEQRLKEVLRCRQRVEALNKLEERGRRAYQAEAAREEQKFLDELSQHRTHSGSGDTFTRTQANPL